MFRARLSRLTNALSSATASETTPSVSSAYSADSADAFEDADPAEVPNFDFDRMVTAFENVTFAPVDPSSSPQTQTQTQMQGGLPETGCFLCAMSEVLLLFDHLGTAFTFVRRDILAKTTILRTFHQERPVRFKTLERAVCAEVDEGCAAIKVPPSAARTLLRLMWALKFIDVLLDHIRQALQPTSRLPPAERTLRAAVTKAYTAALAEHHSWALRRTVMTAISVLPSLDTFVNKVQAQPAHLERLKSSMTPLVRKMYMFYERKELLHLP